MVNTRNKSSPHLAITTHYKYTRKRRLLPIRLLGSPQATIHYGEVYAYKVSTHPICIGSFIARFISEVVIQKAIELFFLCKIHYYTIMRSKVTNYSGGGERFRSHVNLFYNKICRYYK